MLSVTITEKDGPTTTTTFDKTEVLIGRVKGNDIVLPKTNVSKRHSRIVVKDGKIILIDLKSTNGTFINGRKITGPHVMQEGDKVFIGDFTIEVREIGGAPSPMGMVPQMSAAPGMGAPSMPPSFGGIPSGASLPPVGMPMDHNMPMSAPAHSPAIPGPNPGGFQRPSLSGMPAIGGPSLGAGHMPAPAAPAMGPGSMPGASNEPAPMGPGMNQPAAPMAPVAPAAPISPVAPAAPAAPAAPVAPVAPVAPAAPVLSSPADLIAPSGPASQPLSVGRSLSSGPVKPSGISAPVGEGLLNKSILPSSSATDRSLSGTSKVNASRASSSAARKEFSAAALPEDIIVDDARNVETENLLKAARIVMDRYLSENDFQAILAQPYMPDQETQDMCYNNLTNCVNATRASLGNINTETLLDFLLKEATGLGAIDTLIDDPDVSAFTVYNFETIIVDRLGRREISHLQFTSNDTLYLASQRLLAFQGINPQTAPAVSEIRFQDGTQLEVILPPVAVTSTSIVVRKTNHAFNALSALVQKEALSAEMSKFLNLCVKARRNILIAGAQCAGRTTLLNALGAEIPNGERIVTVENSAMLAMPQMYVMSLEAQNDSFPGGDLASLIRQCGRLRAERVLVDSIQTPADASAFLNAICAGAQGSIATITSLTADDAIGLLKRMVAADNTARSLVGNIDIVITVRAFTDARRRIVEISEVVTEDDGTIRLTPIFGWLGNGMGSKATGSGSFKALGNTPQFCSDLERGGVALDASMFNA